MTVSYLNEIKSLIFLKEGLFDMRLNFPLFSQLFLLELACGWLEMVILEVWGGRGSLDCPAGMRVISFLRQSFMFLMLEVSISLRS